MNFSFTSAVETRPESHTKRALGRGTGCGHAQQVIGVAAAAAVLGLLWYFLSAGSASHAPPPPVVIVAQAGSKNVTVFEHTIGTVVAEATVQVTARVSGQLMKAYFTEGQMVRAGDLLFLIDPKPFQAALEQAGAQLAKDQAILFSAQNDQKRYDTLFAQNAASSQQRDQADATAKGLLATVASDRAVLDVAKLNLGYTQIRSPVNGKTGPILIQPGNLIGANGANALVVVTQIRPIKVSFSLPQSDLPLIQARARDHTLLATVDPHQSKAGLISAPVDFVDNQINPQTGTIELRATFDNNDQSLVPGQLIDVAVSLNNLKRATVVPREAVNDGPNGRYVFVIPPNAVAAMQPVTVLFDDGTDMAIAGDVKPGDKVVIDGQLRVLPGKKVSIQQKHVKKANTGDQS